MPIFDFVGYTEQLQKLKTGKLFYTYFNEICHNEWLCRVNIIAADFYFFLVVFQNVLLCKVK